jgi:hypothetical protein
VKSVVTWRYRLILPSSVPAIVAEHREQRNNKTLVGEELQPMCWNRPVHYRPGGLFVDKTMKLIEVTEAFGTVMARTCKIQTTNLAICPGNA